MSDWRYRVLMRWYALNKGDAIFFAALPLPVVLLGVLVGLAHADYSRIQAERERRAELICLAENIYHEARGEPVEGQYAVAEVTLNRVASRAFPGTVCAVVYEKRWDPSRRRWVGAFSWTELALPRPRGAAWDRALEIARAAYDGESVRRVDEALFYHATHIEPRWARTMEPVARIGRHVFYR